MFIFKKFAVNIHKLVIFSCYKVFLFLVGWNYPYTAWLFLLLSIHSATRFTETAIHKRVNSEKIHSVLLQLVSNLSSVLYPFSCIYIKE
jgi:hypothetical protein